MVLKKYDVHVDAKYSHNFSVKAKNKSEAKKKALDKMKKKVNSSNFETYAEEIKEW